VKRDPFARLKEETGRATVADLIPLAQPRRRKREWERAHRGKTYRVPGSLVERAKAVRKVILALAQKHMTTTSDVAEALLAYAIGQAKAGSLSLQFSPPSSGRRKMSVQVVDGSGWPEVVDIKTVLRSKRSDLRLTYRLSDEMDREIHRLAGGSALHGEVLVVLLEAAVAALQSGRIGLRAEPEVVRQRVTAW